MPTPKHSAVVFDLGGVLIDWNPRYLYRKRFNGDEAAVEHFLTHVCTSEWNVRQDAGRTFAEATALLTRSHPQLREHIEAWLTGFDEMMAGPIQGTVDILAELRARGTPLFALTNWSAETFPYALARFAFLGWFVDIVVSGKLGIIKPDPAIFQHLLTGHNLQPAQTIFIDDAVHNVAGAAAVGMHGLRFTSPEALRRDLVALGLLG
jgi:2-haloacid dehalogenase